MRCKAKSISRLWGAGVWLLHVLLSKSASEPAAEGIDLVQIVDGLRQPTALVSSKDGTGRLFIVEQCARILVLKHGRVKAKPFLDLTNIVRCSDSEEGLLGLAFHPNFKSNGYFFVNFSYGGFDLTRSTIVRRYSVFPDRPDVADPRSRVNILRFSQPYGNHNGGDLAFGPDGYLYIASGDGGSGGDPHNNGQSKGNLLGKILRLDVDNPSSIIPSDNPFVDEPDARGEIWVYGVRNPWKMSFDSATGDLFFADVGQDKVEEVNYQPAGSSGGENYGWRRMEGNLCYNPDSDCFDSSLILPILEYRHGRGWGCSVTGGYRYRGTEVPSLEGVYVFGDFCSGYVLGATQSVDGTWATKELIKSGLAISAFGEHENGELYVVHHNRGNGAIYKVTSSSTNCNDDQSFFYRGNPERTCKWILTKGPNKRRRICRRKYKNRRVGKFCPKECKEKCQ